MVVDSGLLSHHEPSLSFAHIVEIYSIIGFLYFPETILLFYGLKLM